MIDRYTDNVDIKLTLYENKDISITIDGQWNKIADPSLSKKRLAVRPVRYVHQGSQRYLSIGYNLVAKHLTLKQHGVDAEKLPPVPAKIPEICYNKIVDTSNGDSRLVHRISLILCLTH